ncbi:MAG: hypothetical protein ACP6IT_08855, partial [Candidatus Thorarchaeota archaeon]
MKGPTRLLVPVAILLAALATAGAQVQEDWRNVFSFENYAMGEVGYDVASDSQGAVYVCGQTGRLTNYDYEAVILKIPPGGETEWFHVIGPDEGEDVWGDALKRLVVDEPNEAVYAVG